MFGRGDSVVRGVGFAQDRDGLLDGATGAGEALRERALSIPERVRACLRLSDAEAHELYRLLYRALDGFSEV